MYLKYKALEAANDITLPCFVTTFGLIGTFRIAIRKKLNSRFEPS
jgi:hypothetical protein